MAIWRICSIDQPIASDARFRSRIRRVNRLSADFRPYVRLVMTRASLLIPATAALVCHAPK